MSGADRAIRISTAAAVLGVAGIAAYVSYQHAFEVVHAHWCTILVSVAVRLLMHPRCRQATALLA